ncbi:MAG: hypothetical protein V8R51_03340 [Clostridia bacterium]
MSSPTQTNTGASAYLGFVSTLAGNPEVLTEKDLENDQTKKRINTTIYRNGTFFWK